MTRISSDEWTDLLDFLKHPDEEQKDSSTLIKSFKELQELKLEKYYHYVKKRIAVRKSEGLSLEDAEWQAMNDTVYYFIEQTKFTLDSLEVNQFIKKMVRTCPLPKAIP